MKPTFWIGIGILGLVSLYNACQGGMHNPVPAGGSTSVQGKGPYYVGEVQPLFQQYCSACHNAVSSIPNWLVYNVAYQKRDLIRARVFISKDMPLNVPMPDSARSIIADWVMAGAPYEAGGEPPVPPTDPPPPTEPPPPPPDPPVDGGWSPWVEAQGCDVTCGGGTLLEVRTCTNPAPANGGAPCDGPSEQQVACNETPCETPPEPVNGGWSPWADVGACSAVCGEGFQTQKRSCNNPIPANGGLTCDGESSRLVSCNKGVCNNIIGYNEQIKPLFQLKCSACHNSGSSIPNWLIYEIAFGGRNAIYDRVFVKKDMPLSGSMLDSERKLVADWVLMGAPQSQPPVPIHGGWTEFANSGSCSKTCGGGSQLQTRTCSNPAPGNGGSDCEGLPTRYVACNVQTCSGGTPNPGDPTVPVDGGWSPWMDDSVCTKTCGGGTKTQSRTCTEPPPSNGGADCVGEFSRQIECNTHLCPIDGGWSSWYNSGECSTKCGGGEQNQIRYCNNPTPENGGAMCVGSSTQAISCNTHICPTISFSKAECFLDASNSGNYYLYIEAEVSPVTGITWWGMNGGWGWFGINFGSDGKSFMNKPGGFIISCPSTVQSMTDRGGWAEFPVKYLGER